MKVLKSHWKVLLCVIIGVLIIGSPLFWYCTPQILQAFKASWLFLGIAIAIIATPLGNRRLSAQQGEAPRLRWLPWWGCIMLFEISLTTVFWGVCELSGRLTPILTSSKDYLFINSLQATLLHSGLFPWALYALLAVSFAYTAYTRQRTAYTCTLLSPFVKLSPNHIWGLVFDVSARIATLCALFSTVTFMSLLLANALGHDALMNVMGLNAASLACVFILLILLINQRTKRYLHTLIIKKQMPASLALYSFVIAAAFLLMILGTLLEKMSHNAVNTPALIQGLLNKGWDVNWQIFAMLWWWAWAPLMGLFIGYFSRGHTVRATLLAVLALPLLVCIALYLMQQQHLTPSLMTDSPKLAAIIALLGFALLTLLMMRKNTMSLLSDLCLPRNDQIKHRAQDAFMSRWLRGTSITYYIYLPTGIAALGIFFFLSVAAFSLNTFLIALALLKGLRRH